RMVALVEGGSSVERAAGGAQRRRRRRGSAGGSSRMVALVGCRGGLMEIVDIVNNFPGQAHRWLVDEGVRARRLLDVDEGVEGRCRDRRASWIIYNLATLRIGAVTGMGITQRGGGRSRARVRRGAAEALVFYKLPLSKTRRWDKSDIAEQLAEEAPPLSGHGP